MAQEEFNMKKILPIGLIALAIILVVVFWSRMTITIDAGHGGVLFRTFQGGLNTEQVYGEWFHFLAAWNKMFVYEGAGHAFFNDTGSRYHKEAAALAWNRTIKFFNVELKT